MLALVVNPVAGVGGPAGLAGSDGAAVQRRAAERGARPRAGERARAALEVVAAAQRPDAPRLAVLTAAGPMGEDAVRAAGLEPRVVHRPGGEASWLATSAASPTSAADTTAAVRALVDAGATLVLFAGGDGTARDVIAGLGPVAETADRADRADRAVRNVGSAGRHAGAGMPDAGASAAASDVSDRVPERDVAVLGVPAGVKMYSPVFAVSPRAAGALAAAWLEASAAGRELPAQLREVLDIDELAMRRARVEPTLYGTALVPYLAGRTQARKAATPASEQAAVAAAARGAVRAMRPGVRYLLGPGGTMAELARELGVPKTPLGVDVVLDGRLVRAQASEAELLDELALGPAKAVVSVIGGQGFLLGRGNQQFSARVLRALGDEPLLVVAPEQKLIELGGRPLLVDTGDAAVDRGLAGFVRVHTGASTTSIYPVDAPEAEASDLDHPHTEGEGHAP